MNQPPPNDQVQPYPQQPSPYGPSPYGVSPGMWGAPGAMDFRAVASCGSRSMVWGVIGIVVGALMTLSGLMASLGGSMLSSMGGATSGMSPTVAGLVALAIGVCSIVVGIFYVRAAGALKAAAQNGDAAMVSQGLRSMGSALLTQIIVFFVGVAVYLILIFTVMSSLMKYKSGGL